MLAYPLALTALLAGSATAVPRSTRQEFIRAMRQQKNLDPMIMANAAKSSALRKTILDEATFVPPGRKLDEVEADNGADSSASQNQNQNQQYYYSQNYIQGTDDAYSFNTDADWQNSWGFDASQYSLSYERCSTVKHFDIEKAAQEDATSPFRAQHFAVLRLCPTKSCDRPDWYLEVEDGQVAEVEPEDTGETYGANGRGCSSNYGTFILDAGRYLQLMAEYEDTQFDMYCNYCEHYMQKMYQKWVNNGGHRDLKFEDFKNHPDLERMLGGYDAEWYSCSVYANACGGDWRQDDYADFLECNEVQKNNGMVAYTQATCAEDGEAITIGLYSDDSCSEDITSKVNIANWIGEQVDEDEMARYYKRINSGMAELIETYGGTTSVDPESVCLPCSVENQAWFLADDDVTQQAQKNQQEGAYQYSHSSQGEIADICDAVFMQSARCDKTLSKWWQRKRDANYAESNALQDLSCEFIDSMRMGKYDTEGNVIMDANRLYNEDGAQGINGNLYVQEYGQGLAEVSPMQIFFLVLSISACAILAVWSSSLHKSLTKGGLKWRPNRGVGAGAEEDEIARQSSGIVVGRSQSNHSSYYMS